MSIKMQFSKIFALILVSFLINNRALAENEFNEKAVLSGVKKVVAEHKKYATCLSLDSTTYKLVLENWEREVGLGMEAIKSYKPSLVFIAKFKLAVATGNLLDEDLTLAEAMEYCHKNEKQVRKFYEFGYSRLSDAIEKAAKVEN